MSQFSHRAISASAGTGKTWALTHRYLALMAAGESPDRICALTFSRKAAGEIFDSIVGRLCDSAVDADARATTAENIARQAVGVSAPDQPRDYVNLLRRLLDQAHRLRVGTLDSFILGIARAFPLELGLPPDVRPMDNSGAEAQALRHALLLRLLDPRQRERDGHADFTGEALLQAVRQANFGRECKSLASQLDVNIADSYDFYREHAGKAWGDEQRIWSAGRWWEMAIPSELSVARSEEYQESLRQAFGIKGDAAQLGQTCARIVDAAAAHAPDRPWPEKLSEAILPQLIEAVRSRSDAPLLRYKRKEYPLPAHCLFPLRAAIANLIDVEIRRALGVTAGLHALLKRYDGLYEEAQRREGRLSFDDFARRLGMDANQPSLNPDAVDRLYIDYRMDGQLDHWLLDEFQDTSDMQWHAIANLIDEVVQDPARRRSFFYVGDIKQSIYGWRGGNYRLFGHVREQCGIQAGDTLTVCRRSLPVVIDTVNAIFDNLPLWTPLAGLDNGPQPAAVEAFMAEWQTHASVREGDGYAALLEYEPRPNGRLRDDACEESENGGDPAQYEAIARVLAETRPTQKDLSAAVLVRNNRQGRACTDVLRRRLVGVPVIHEGTGGIVDNPVVTLLLALVRYAAHPADSLARRHLQMSPWAALRQSSRGDWLKGLPGRFLAMVHEAGFAGALRPWGNRLLETPPHGVGDEFGRQRLNEFLAAAEAFDAGGSRDCDAFDDAIRAHQVKSEAAAGAIRVMTIHQCKGLGFDMVMVPFDPGDKGFGDMRGIDWLRSDYGHTLPSEDGWVLKSPRRTVLNAAGGAALEAFDAARAQANFSQLCVLYVAVTRAKQALYMFVPKRPKTSSTVREADLVRERLTGDTPPATSVQYDLPLLYAAGNPEWCVNPPGKTPKDHETMIDRPDTLIVKQVAEAGRREPSKDRSEDRPFPARYIFNPEAGDVRYFGSAIHRLFERIEWVEEVDLDDVVAAWRAASTESGALLRRVEEQFRLCITAPDVRALLTRPAGAQAEVWRETPFDYVRLHDGGREILTGRFDRLVIERDQGGCPRRATVVDFKSNRVADTAAMQESADGYRRQMQDYAAAAARLLELPDEAVQAVLLFTRMARVFTFSNHLP